MKLERRNLPYSQPEITCSKSTIKSLEQGMKDLQRHENDANEELLSLTGLSRNICAIVLTFLLMIVLSF